MRAWTRRIGVLALVLVVGAGFHLALRERPLPVDTAVIDPARFVWATCRLCVAWRRHPPFPRTEFGPPPLGSPGALAFFSS